MRILHIITSLRQGGAERLVSLILPLLKKNGHEVELVIFDGKKTNFYNQLIDEQVKIYSLGNGVLQMWNPLHIFKLRKLIRNGNYDVIHTHNTPSQLLTSYAVKKDCPVLVTTEHNTTNRRRNWVWYRPIERRMYRKYDSVVCVSQKTKDNLENFLNTYLPGIKIVIPNGIDLENYSAISENVVLRRQKSDNRHIILMIGAFRKQKDQATLIKAINLLPENYYLWLAGGWKGRKSCENLVQKIGLKDRVEFLGISDDIPELLAKSDVVVLSSHYEGMPMSAIEAMASGKPFIGSDVEGIREIADGAGILFPEGDSKALADAIKEICQDPDYYNRIAEQCRKRASKYDINTTVKGYEELYLQLLKNKHNKEVDD